MQRFGVEMDEFELKIFNLTVYLPCIFIWFLARIYRVFASGCSHSYFFVEKKRPFLTVYFRCILGSHRVFWRFHRW